MDENSIEHETSDITGLNGSNIDIDATQITNAPYCHSLPMSFERADSKDYGVTWWECRVCGHIKNSEHSK